MTEDPIAQVERNRKTLEQLIVWMAQTAGLAMFSPIAKASKKRNKEG